MPARLGELFRAEYFKKSFGLSRVWALTSIVIERLFDGLTVVICLGFGLLLAAAARKGAGILLDILATGGILFGAMLLAALWLSGSPLCRVLFHDFLDCPHGLGWFRRASGLSAQRRNVTRRAK